MDFFLRTQERVRKSYGKRAISVRAAEVLLYHVNISPQILSERAFFLHCQSILLHCSFLTVTFINIGSQIFRRFKVIS